MRQDDLETELAKRARALAYCVELADNGLRRCNLALKSLQPKQPGRITLTEEECGGQSAPLLSNVRWRLVRWRIRQQYSDGTVRWEAERLSMKSVGRRVSSHMQFRDTALEVHVVLRVAVLLLKWRADLMQIAARFVSGADEHNRAGAPSAARRLAAVTDAMNRVRARRAAAQVSVGEIAKRKA